MDSLGDQLAARTWFGSPSLRTKVAAGVILPLIVILGLWIVIEYRRERRIMLNELSNLAAYTGRVVEAELRHQMVEDDAEAIQDFLNVVAAGGQFENLYVLDTAGKVAFAPLGENVGKQFDNREAECQPCHRLPAEQRPTSVAVTNSAGVPVFRSVQPIENGPECVQCHEAESNLNGILLIDIPAGPFTAQLSTYLQGRLLLAMAAVVIIALVAAFLVDRFALRRLHRLVNAIAGAGKEQSLALLPEKPTDEIGRLVAAFNTMTREVEARISQNERLSDQLRQENRQRGRLLKRLITAQEDERIRLARELHDELGQSLGGLDLHVQALEAH